MNAALTGVPFLFPPALLRARKGGYRLGRTQWTWFRTTVRNSDRNSIVATASAFHRGARAILPCNRFHDEYLGATAGPMSIRTNDGPPRPCSSADAVSTRHCHQQIRTTRTDSYGERAMPVPARYHPAAAGSPITAPIPSRRGRAKRMQRNTFCSDLLTNKYFCA